MFGSSRFAGLATVVALMLTGCAGQTAGSSESPSAQPSSSVPTAPADVEASFKAIAGDSCDRAYSEGVLEESADGIMFLVPEGQAYQDFSAAFDTELDGIGVIWSTEVFFACAASIGYQMSAEGSAEYPIVVTFDESTGDYRAQVEVEDYGTLDYTYTVADGVFTGVEWVSPEESGTTTISYGPPSNEHIDVLHRAVDEFLAGQ